MRRLRQEPIPAGRADMPGVRGPTDRQLPKTAAGPGRAVRVVRDRTIQTEPEALPGVRRQSVCSRQAQEGQTDGRRTVHSLRQKPGPPGQHDVPTLPHQEQPGRPQGEGAGRLEGIAARTTNTHCHSPTGLSVTTMMTANPTSSTNDVTVQTGSPATVV